MNNEITIWTYVTRNDMKNDREHGEFLMAISRETDPFLYGPCTLPYDTAKSNGDIKQDAMRITSEQTGIDTNYEDAAIANFTTFEVKNKDFTGSTNGEDVIAIDTRFGRYKKFTGKVVVLRAKYPTQKPQEMISTRHNPSFVTDSGRYKGQSSFTPVCKFILERLWKNRY